LPRLWLLIDSSSRWRSPSFWVAQRFSVAVTLHRFEYGFRRRAPKALETYFPAPSSFCFTRTTVIFENPSSNVGAFNLLAILRMISSGTARPRR
jgi:hypothetical protein